MSAITLNFRTDATERAIRQLKAKAPAAIARALNRSIASGKTVMVRAIAQDMGLKQADIRDKVLITPATPQRLVAQLAASRKKIPLIDFGAKGPMPSRGQGKGVTARNPGGAGRYPHAFIATVGTGRHTGVFERRAGANRHSKQPRFGQLPIRELFGPSLGHVFDKYRPMGLARAEEQLVKNVAHELRFALTQAT